MKRNSYFIKYMLIVFKVLKLMERKPYEALRSDFDGDIELDEISVFETLKSMKIENFSE